MSTVLSNTVTPVSTGGGKHKKPSVADLINDIEPEGTPLFSSIKHGTTTSTTPEWLEERQAMPTITPVRNGAEFVNDAQTQAVMLRNTCQIASRVFSVSGSQKAIKTYGGDSQMTRLRVTNGKQLKLEVELASLGNTTSSTADTDPRTMGGLQSWVTLGDRGQGGAHGGFNEATKLTTAATAGTKRAFTKELLDKVILQGFNEGADSNTILCSGFIKGQFASFLGQNSVVGTQIQTSKDSKVTAVSTVDVYRGTSGGNLAIKADPTLATNTELASNVFIFNPKNLELKFLRKFKETPLAVTGDAERRSIVTEFTLCPRSRNAISIVADVFGTTAIT